MDIRNKTRCFRPSKRFELFVGQWEQKQLVEHKDRVRKVAPRIDFSTPASASYEHIRLKSKKRQKESERNNEVMMNNLILLKHLMEIASTKRVDDGVRIRSRQTQRIDWKEILEHILRMRRQQLEKLRYDLEEELARDSPAGRPLSQPCEATVKDASPSEDTKSKAKTQKRPQTAVARSSSATRSASESRLRRDQSRKTTTTKREVTLDRESAKR